MPTGLSGARRKGLQAPEIQWGLVKFCLRAQVDPKKLENLLMFFNWATLQIFLGALGNSNSGGPRCSTKMSVESPGLVHQPIPPHPHPSPPPSCLEPHVCTSIVSGNGLQSVRHQAIRSTAELMLTFLRINWKKMNWIGIELNWQILNQFWIGIEQSGTKPDLVAKILATKIGNLWA